MLSVLVFLGAARSCLAIGGDHYTAAVDLGSKVPAEYVRPVQVPLTLEPGEPQDVTGSHWLTWVCPESGIYKAEGIYIKQPPEGTGWGYYISGLDPLVRVYTGTSLPVAVEQTYVPMGDSGGYLPKIFRGTAGQRYHFRTGLSPYLGMIGNFSTPVIAADLTWWGLGWGKDFTFRLTRLPGPPVNDDFANAVQLPAAADADAEVAGTNIGATNEPGEVLGNYESGDTVWHQWTAARTGRYELRLSSPAFLRLAVFSGKTVNQLTWMHGDSPNYNDPTMGTVRLRWNAAAGDQRWFRINGNNTGQQGSYTLQLHRLVPPVNDDLANALPLTGAMPLSVTGTTVDASPEPGALEENSYSNSSVWWKWTSSTSGWCELAGDCAVGAMTGGKVVGYTLDNNPPLRFQVEAGRDYFLRAATSFLQEKPVAITLRPIAGLEHSTPEAALDMGSAASFSSPAVAVPPGIFINGSNQTANAALWCRWTAPVSGWVALDTEGSDEGGDLSVSAVEEPRAPLQTFFNHRARAQSWQPLVNYPQPFSLWSFSLFPRTDRRVLPEKLVQDAALAPLTARLLQRVEAGKTYLMAATPASTADGAPALVKVNLRPAAGPPSVVSVKVRDLPPVTERDAHFLEAVVAVSSPNGLVRANCSLMGTTVYLTEESRISGDVRAGEYRAVVPLTVGYSSGGGSPAPVQVSLVDTRGGFYFPSVESPLKILSQPSSVTDATADRQPPEVEGGDSSASYGSWLNPILVPSAPTQVIRPHGKAMTVTLRLGIRDFGGSGFASGELSIAPAASRNPQTGGVTLLPANTKGCAITSFGPENRVAGDAVLGIYEVPLTIPAYAPAGQVMCRLRDAAGNAAGRWFPDGIYYDGFPGNPGPGVIFQNGFIIGPDTTGTRGMQNASATAAGRDSLNYNSINLYAYSFSDSVVLPYVIEQDGPTDSTPPVISGTTAVLDGQGNVRFSARITDDLSGVSGGTVRLVDPFGLVEKELAFTAAARISGTALDGWYEVLVPVPAYGFGGAHWLSVVAVDQAGWTAEARRIGSVTLPDRTVQDQRRPALTRFQISPAAVNLTAGPAEITVSLAAADDRPGLTARLRILDGSGVLLVEKQVGCDQPVLDCMASVPLPARALIGPSAGARVEVILTDAAGRTESYGTPGGAEWPEGSAVSLALGPVSDPFALWAASWPGVPALPPDAVRDSDHDGVADLLEFALGSDPGTGPAADVFAAHAPRLIAGPDFSSVTVPNGVPNRLSVDFSCTPAPAFAKTGSEFRCGPWRLQLEESADLIHWTTSALAERDFSGEAHLIRTPALNEPGRHFRLRVTR